VKGNLIIQFDVDFPKRINSAAASKIASILPGELHRVEESDDMEPCSLREFNAAAAQEEYEQNKSAYDSDDDDEGGGGHGRGVQCAQG